MQYHVSTFPSHDQSYCNRNSNGQGFTIQCTPMHCHRCPKGSHGEWKGVTYRASCDAYNTYNPPTVAENLFIVSYSKALEIMLPAPPPNIMLSLTKTVTKPLQVSKICSKKSHGGTFLLFQKVVTSRTGFLNNHSFHHFTYTYLIFIFYCSHLMSPILLVVFLKYSTPSLACHNY